MGERLESDSQLAVSTIISNGSRSAANGGNVSINFFLNSVQRSRIRTQEISSRKANIGRGDVDMKGAKASWHISCHVGSNTGRLSRTHHMI